MQKIKHCMLVAWIDPESRNQTLKAGQSVAVWAVCPIFFFFKTLPVA